MRQTKISLGVLLSATFASAQVASSAQLVGGQVVAGPSASAPMLPGTDIWPGYVRHANHVVNAAALTVAHQQDAVSVGLDWQLSSQAVTAPSLARCEVLYQLASPIAQAGEWRIEWLPSLSGTGQASITIDVYDDGVVDAVAATTIPVAFGQGAFPLIVRVTAEASATAGSVQGPFGSSWSYYGTAAGQLQIRFVPTHAASLVVASQPCANAPALTTTPDLAEGIQLEGICSATEQFAVFALGFQAVDLPLPLSASCRQLIDPVVALLHPVLPATPVRDAIAVPAAVRPAWFLAQLVALDATNMTLSASDLIRTDIQ